MLSQVSAPGESRVTRDPGNQASRSCSPMHLQATFIVGFKAFRWLLDELEIKQPRRFKNETANSS